MSKFCSKCGSMCFDEARVCGNCGNILEAPQQNNFSQNQYQQAQPQPQFQPGYAQNIQPAGFTPTPAPKKSKKGLIIGVVAVIIAVIIAVVVTVLVMNNSDGKKTDEDDEEVVELTGSEATLDKFIKAYDKKDGDAIYQLIPRFMEDVFDYYGRDVENAIEADIENFYDYMEDINSNLDGNLSLSYKITDEDQISNSYLEDFIDLFERYSDNFDEDKLTDSILYEVKVTAECNGEKEKVDLELYLIKYDGKWYYCGNEWYFDEYDYDYTTSYRNNTTSYYDYYDYYDYYNNTTSYYDYYDDYYYYY